MFVLDLENVSFNRGDKNILDDVSMSFMDKKITVIIGPSGSGKTTILKMLSNQVLCSSGFVKVNGCDIKKLNNLEISIFKKNIGFLFQNGALFPDLSVYDNVAYPIIEYTNFDKNIINDIVLMKLQAVGLKKAGDLMPYQLSLGMMKRVAIARAIALDPFVLMYDEPFAGQDPLSIKMLLKLINSLNKFSRITTIIVSHDIHESLSIADYVYVLNNKKIIGSGTPYSIRSSENKFIRSFVNVKFDF